MWTMMRMRTASLHNTTRGGITKTLKNFLLEIQNGL
jgi:hypothetical protein